MLSNTEFTADSSSVNPPLNVDFGSIVDRLAITYENIAKARIEASNPPRNPPPGSFGYSPQNDTKATTKNLAPGTLPPAPGGLLSGISSENMMWIGLGVVLVFVLGLFGMRRA